MLLSLSSTSAWNMIYVWAWAEPTLEIPLPSEPESSQAWTYDLLLNTSRAWLGFEFVSKPSRVSVSVKYKLIWTYFSAQTRNLYGQNSQSWLFSSQTIPENAQSAIFILFYQNYCWVEIIEGEKRVENLRCRADVVTIIVKNTYIYIRL